MKNKVNNEKGSSKDDINTWKEKSSKEVKARLPRGKQAQAKKLIYRKKSTPKSGTKKSPCKSPSQGKKAGYKITDFLLTKKESNPTSALTGMALANDPETTCAADAKTAQDIERTCADVGKINIPTPSQIKPV
ncbi:hypothetical protein NDU88_001153 [Pleurodeles waltl]|uniref:Uncharacterized protein n=1 Tax=Pleurodeles waltl TaxID=8319 RepID=A0AAV7U5K6_PLEWA|nr:hypothetical protein NDU88_001153 [Pleurodeles waltl]